MLLPRRDLSSAACGLLLPSVLLLWLLPLPLACSCDRGGATGSVDRSSRTGRSEQIGPEQLTQGFLARFPQLWDQLLGEAVPPGQALAQALAERGEGLAERIVLERVYAGGAAGELRFVGTQGLLTPAGELLVAELAALGEHGIDPQTLGPAELEARQVELRHAREQAATLTVPPPPPRGEELQALRRLVEALEPPLRLPEAEQALLARLTATTGPLPRLATAFVEACRSRQQQLGAAAGVELALADGLLRHARLLRRSNTVSAERAALAAGVRGVAGAGGAGRAGGEPPPAPAEPASSLPPVADGGAEDASGAGEGGSAASSPASGVPAALVLADREGYVRLLLEQDLRSVQDRESLARLLEQLQPPYPQYRPLQAALKRYRQLAAEGGWPVVPAERGVRPGKSHPTVALLEQRLAVEGFFAGSPDARYDAETEQAVRRYQEAHQLEVTGQPHPVFWKSLNIPAQRRVRAIELTLQRWRESRIGDDRYYVLINVPDFYLELWMDGERLLRNRIVAGQNRGTRCDDETSTEVLAHATPLQSARIEYLVFSPYWNVTRRIKELELDPERAKDPLHYEKNGYEVMERGTPREWVREMPGPGNSLGFVKFIFPNPHATFVHDTPQKELFRQPVRAFSHGCMRLEEPLQLARQLLREDGQWDEQAYQVRYQSWQSMSFASLKESYDPERYETLRQRATELERNIYLGRPVPVHVEYYTVRVDDAGQVQFLADIYGYDEQLLNPKPPKKCTPEGKSARWSFKRIPEKLAEYQRDAVRLVPEILATAEKAKKLQAKGTWLERRLLKEAKKIDNFMAQHENYAKSIQEAHDQLARALAERDGRWNKRLEEEAVRLQRLLRGLAQMNAKARQLCQQVEQAVSSK